LESYFDHIKGIAVATTQIQTDVNLSFHVHTTKRNKRTYPITMPIDAATPPHNNSLAIHTCVGSNAVLGPYDMMTINMYCPRISPPVSVKRLAWEVL
jgi:hypothetical protein